MFLSLILEVPVNYMILAHEIKDVHLKPRKLVTLQSKRTPIHASLKFLGQMLRMSWFGQKETWTRDAKSL
jgi:hypothetical protein